MKLFVVSLCGRDSMLNPPIVPYVTDDKTIAWGRVRELYRDLVKEEGYADTVDVQWFGIDHVEVFYGAMENQSSIALDTVVLQ